MKNGLFWILRLWRVALTRATRRNIPEEAIHLIVCSQTLNMQMTPSPICRAKPELHAIKKQTTHITGAGS
jgi:hypothetical protein